MTYKEAIKYLIPPVATSTEPSAEYLKQKEAYDLAIKALKIVDDVNHKIYRNENCPQKYKCYDYQGYHCAGCNWEKKGVRKND